MHMFMHMCVLVRVHVHVGMCVCMHMFICKCVCVCVCASVCMCMHVCVHGYACVLAGLRTIHRLSLRCVQLWFSAVVSACFREEPLGLEGDGCLSLWHRDKI